MPQQNLSTYVWNPYLRAYISVTGEKVGTTDLRKIVEEIRSGVNDRLAQTAKKLQDGEILNLTQFSLDFKDEIKNLYVSTHVLARGGVEMMDNSSWGMLGSALREQYDFINTMIRDIENANIGVKDSSGEVIVRDNGIPELGDDFLNRVDMYTDSGWGAAGEFENVVRDREVNLGSLERRVLGDSKQSCDDCIEMADRDWQPAGLLPDIGDTECGPGCNCTFEFENEELQSLAESFGSDEKAFRKSLKSLNLVDQSLIPIIISRISLFAQEFPEPMKLLVGIEAQEDREGTFASVAEQDNKFYLVFNTRYWANEFDLRTLLIDASMADTVSTSPVDTIEGTIDHELGHILDSWILANQPEGEHRGSDNPVWESEEAKILTRYSKAGPVEVFAEAFAIRQTWGLEFLHDPLIREAVFQAVTFASGDKLIM